MKEKSRTDREACDRIKSENPIYEALISFYQNIIDIRGYYLDLLHTSITQVEIDDRIIPSKIKEGFPLIDVQNLQIDYSLMKKYFLKLLSMVNGVPEKDTEKLTALAASKNEFKKAVRKALRGETHAGYPNSLTFFLKESITPLLKVHASFLRDRPELKDWKYGYCPICGNQPVVGILKGEDGKKYMVCGACSSEWPFPRLKCPSCGTEFQEHLSYLRSQEDWRHRIELCDNCRTYLKVIDLRSAGQNVYSDIENLVTMHLDIIARKEGYTGNINTFPTDDQLRQPV